MKPKSLIGMMLLVPALTGCASIPAGPRVAVMPAPGKPFEQFVAEDRLCRGYAEQSVGVTPAGASAQDMAVGALIGTAIGAAAGAAIGGHRGAATGAGIGLAGGALAGAGQSNETMHDLQWRYDVAYQQCMYAKGNQLPSGAYQQQPVTVIQVPPSAAPVQVVPTPYPPPPPR
ncbi:MAG: hypothetical protein ACOY3Z_05515 [Thermodesulfobacteriota bacterium]